MDKLLRVSMVFLFVAVWANTGLAFADEGDPYISGSFGLTSLNDIENDFGSVVLDTEFTPGFNLSGALGVELQNNFRTEGELTFRLAPADTFAGFDAEGSASAISIMGNVYYDIPIPESRLSPYFGLGIGVGLLMANDIGASGGTVTSDSGVGFNYQIMLGAAYEIDSQNALTFGYRFWGSTDVDLEDEAGTEYTATAISANEFLVGIRHSF